MRPQPLLAAAILVGLVAAARGDERRQEWKTTRKRDGKVLVMVSNILERASSEFLIELVPEGQLYGTWRQREDQRLTLQLCDPIEGQCVHAATPLGPEGRPPMMRIEGPSMGF